MGGLRQKMPVTFWTFIAGTLALAAVWPLSGFFSKDAVLAQALDRHNYALFALGALVAALTAFYMFRLVFVVFGGTGKSEAAGHAHESPQVILWPLRILATLSIVGGVIGIEGIYERHFEAAEGATELSFWQQLFYPFEHSLGPAVIGLAAAALGILGAWALYAGAKTDPLPAKLGAVSRAMSNRFYFDELYEETFIRAHDFIAAVANFIDRWIISGLVLFIHGTTELTGRALRLVQNGNLQTYAFLFAMGAAVVLYFALK
jgi:NADH-quinone oxidoreductase subunit L